MSSLIVISYLALLALQQQEPDVRSRCGLAGDPRVGANFNPFTLGSTMANYNIHVLHYGIFHLAVNMYALCSVGCWNLPWG
jgi:hypothetical protein